MNAPRSTLQARSTPAGTLASLFSGFEYGFAGLIVFLASGAVIMGIFRAADQSDSGWIQILWGVMYSITVLLIIARRRQVARAFRLLRKDPLLLGLILYTMASFLWAADPVLTGKRVIIFGATTLMGVYLAVRFSLYDIARIVGGATFCATILSLIVLVVAPDIGLYVDGRAIGIQGVFGNKNILGRATSLGVAMAFFLWKDPWAGRTSLWAMAFYVMFAVTLLSQSITSALAVAVVVVLSPLLGTLRVRGKLLIPIASVTAMFLGTIIYFVLTNSKYLLTLLGRDLTLSGRLPIWGATVLLIYSNLFLGYGYGADWLNAMGDLAFLFQESFSNWEPTHAHNGFLQIGFELGLIGLGLLVVHLLVFTARAVRWVRLNPSSYAAYIPLAFIVVLVAANLTQSTMMSRNNVYWILYVALSLSLSNLLLARKRQQNRSRGELDGA